LGSDPPRNYDLAVSATLPGDPESFAQRRT
jgi:hypothetical protein